MDCPFAISGDTLVAAPVGRLDFSTGEVFKGLLQAELEATGARHLVLDMEGLDYLSSAGIREILLAARRMTREGGSFSACAPQASVREILDIAQFTSAYPLYETRPEAIAAACSLGSVAS